MHAQKSFNSVWIIDAVDPNYRFEMQGQIVTANAPILFRHCQTSNFLGCDNIILKNDFGKENEVFVSNQSTKNRSQNLALEKTGRITGDVPTKFQEDQNIFMAVTAPDESYALPIDELCKFTIEDLVKEIKAKILERSNSGIKGIARIFKAMDDNGNHQLDVDDFRWGLIDYGITITKEEACKVMDHFDRDKNGTVDFDEFLRALKGDLNDFRKSFIQQAY